MARKPKEPEAEVEQPEAEPTKEEKPARIVQNGITRPADGSKTGRVWEIADAVSAEHGRPATRKEVMDIGVAEGMSTGTLGTQYGKWRTFNGLTKAKPSDPPEMPSEPEAETEDA